MGWVDKLSGKGARPVEKSEGPARPSSGPPFCEVLSRVASQAKLKILQQSDNYVMCQFAFPDQRHQSVHLFYAGELGDQRIASISTPVLELPGGQLPAGVGQGLLEENGRMKIGSFAINSIANKHFLVLQHNMILDTLDPEEFRIVVGTLAVVADNWEKKLGGGEDKF